MTIELVIVADYAALSRAGADCVAAVVQAKPAAALLLATGDTPMGLYAELAKRRRQGALDTSRLRVFQLDAYLGLAPDDRRSLYGWLKRSFLDPLGIAPERVTRLPGDAPDPAAAAEAFDRALAAAGGIDLAVLGLGPNGHLGFNEPPGAAASPTRVVDLTEASLESNARYWGGRSQVPRQALTAGLAAILAARQIVLVVAGAHKHAVLRQAVEGPVTPDVPASFLQQAPATVIADRAAWGGPAA
jgi:glucosamine-6-phosphate deaminase